MTRSLTQALSSGPKTSVQADLVCALVCVCVQEPCDLCPASAEDDGFQHRDTWAAGPGKCLAPLQQPPQKHRGESPVTVASITQSTDSSLLWCQNYFGIKCPSSLNSNIHLISDLWLVYRLHSQFLLMLTRSTQIAIVPQLWANWSAPPRPFFSERTTSAFCLCVHFGSSNYVGTRAQL